MSSDLGSLVELLSFSLNLKKSFRVVPGEVDVGFKYTFEIEIGIIYSDYSR